MKGLCATVLSLGLLATLVSSQTLQNTYINDKTYRVYLNTGGITWDDAQSFCEGGGAGDLAVFDDRAAYLEVISDLIDDYPTATEFHIGYFKPADSAYQYSVSGRKATFSNNYRPSTTLSLTATECLYLELDYPGNPVENLGRSFWAPNGDCGNDDTLDFFICQDVDDPPCTAVEDACNGVGFERETNDFCFWEPCPGRVLEKKTAQKYCAKNGGELFNIYDLDDLQYLKDQGFFDLTENSPINWYWLGLSQETDEGVPTWPNGFPTDGLVNSLWENPVNFGSSLDAAGYTALYTPTTDTFNLFNNAPFVELDLINDHLNQGGFDRLRREAFVICEAQEDDFCLDNSPDVQYATKSIYDDRVKYTCKDGFEFMDGDTVKSYDCSCNLTSLENLDVPKRCWLINPCDDGPPICEHTCHFTNQYFRPYYCSCAKGYKLGSDGRRCNDINECEDNTDNCPDYSICINKPGTFSCQCNRGYEWDRYGKCVANKVLYSNRLVFIVTLDKPFDEDFTDKDSTEYANLLSAIRALVYYIFEGDLSVNDLDVREGSLRLRIVLGIDRVVSVAEQSQLALQFAKGVRAAGSITVGLQRCEFTGSVYYESGFEGSQIAITSLCSIYDATNFCSGSKCVADDYRPSCQCRDGYSGDYCDVRDDDDDDDLRPAEIALIVAVIILLIFVICLCCWICCLWNSVSRRQRHHGHHGSVGPTVEVGAAYGAYGVVQKRRSHWW